MWQYTSTGRIDGINGYVDRDIAYKDYPQIIKDNNLNDLKEDEELKVGDKVKIINYGNASSYGDKNRAAGLGYIRYITAIYNNRPYPYQVGLKNDTSSVSTIGFYKKDALKKVE